MKPCAPIRYDSSMPISDWDKLDGKVSKQAFELGYAERSNLTLEEFRRWLIALPCECGEEDCEGWQAVSLRTWKREQREARRSK